MVNIRVCVLMACAAVFGGCEDPPVPYDSSDAHYSVDVTMGRLFYDDGPITLRRDMSVYSVREERRMAWADVPVTYLYALTLPSGEQREYRNEDQRAGQRAGDLKKIPGGPDYLPPGDYKLNVALVTADGRNVQGRFTRAFTVRSRELKVTLSADRTSYAAGDVIKIEMDLTNLTAKAITFAGKNPDACKLTSKWGSDWMDLRGLVLPRSLAPGETVRLDSLEFTAGETDRRFNVGARRAWFPAPFGRKVTNCPPSPSRRRSVAVAAERLRRPAV